MTVCGCLRVWLYVAVVVCGCMWLSACAAVWLYVVVCVYGCMWLWLYVVVCVCGCVTVSLLSPSACAYSLLNVECTLGTSMRPST